jgi:nucleotide-binding universal stress UspA family protein
LLPLNVIIGYDNSEASDYIFSDVLAAGLPGDTHFVVVSATDIEPLSAESQRDMDGLLDVEKATWQKNISQEEREFLTTRLQSAKDYVAKRTAEVEAEVAAAAEKLRQQFPGATVDSAGIMGSPYQALAEQSRKHNADLIIVGSQSASSLSRFFLGSVSQRVLGQADISVRIARVQARPDPTTLNLAIAFDGSDDAQRAVDVVAARQWPANTSVRVVTVEEPKSLGFLVSTLGRLRHSSDVAAEGAGDNDLVHYLAATACERLKKAGINAKPVGLIGDPKQELVKLADEWQADCIYLGAHGHHAKGQHQLGAVASVIATRAHCSLEVVR